MLYNELVNKCKEVANAYNLGAYLTDESESANNLRSEAAAKVREWFYKFDLQPVDKSKRKFAFEDKNEYVHTAFYQTGIYIHKKDKTRTIHNVPTSKRYSKEYREKAQNDANFQTANGLELLNLASNSIQKSVEESKKANARELLTAEFEAKDARIAELEAKIAAFEAAKAKQAKATKKAKKAI